MDILKKYNLTAGKIAKIAGLAVLCVIVIAFSIKMIGAAFTMTRIGVPSLSLGQGATYSSVLMKGTAESADYGLAAGEPSLSVRNVAVMPPEPDGTVPGDDAEEYEVTEYSASIETRHLDETCGAIAGLKAKDYVIFESAGEYDRGCNYSFKVKRANVAEVLALIETLDPKDLDENTRTIKRQIEDFTSELDILQKKLDSINDTLESAIEAYDEITDVAARARDAESLAKIIDSKIRIIERLTQERINVSSEMERLARSKAEQLDRLEYTYFYVHVIELKFIDGEQLADSWKAAIKDFVSDANAIVQSLSVGLLAVLLVIVQYAIYLLILVLLAKYGWRVVRWIWKS